MDHALYFTVLNVDHALYLTVLNVDHPLYCTVLYCTHHGPCPFCPVLCLEHIGAFQGDLDGLGSLGQHWYSAGDTRTLLYNRLDARCETLTEEDTMRQMAMVRGRT